MDFFTGTLTREGGEGILLCRLTDGRLEKTGLIDGLTDPNYQILSPDAARLYSVSSDADENGMRGCVSEYDVSGAHPLMLNRRPTFGNGPCHLTLSPGNRFLYCANYGTGSIAVFPLEGGLGPSVQTVRHEGSGPHPTRQAGPHVHQTVFLPGTMTLCAADLGTDSLYLYHASPENGCLSLLSTVRLHGGPRHALCRDGGILYLVHELSSEVTVLRAESEKMTVLQTLSTLPDGYDGTNTAAAIRLLPDGRTLAVSNRGHGSAALYDILPSGLLKPLGHIPGGIYPRDFVPLADGRFLFADQRQGVLLTDRTGAVLDLLPQPGAVCITPLPCGRG